MLYEVITDDLAKIEERMKKLVKDGLEIERFELSGEEAIKLMTRNNFV